MKLKVETSDGYRLAAEIHGPADAPAVLFLNSIGCDRALWDSQVTALEREFRCVLYDTRGHGRSDAPAGDYTLERLAADAFDVLDTAEVGRAHLCGLSLGGLTAQQLAITAPERVASLTLANTAARIGTRESWETRRTLVLTHGLEAIADMAVERFFSPGFRHGHPDMVAEWRGRVAASSAPGYAGCCAALREADLTACVGAICAPTLVIGGEADVATPPRETAALAAAIPGAAHRVLPAGHLSNVEEPRAFNAALWAHLGRA